ncbi:hypothetical protein ACIHAA_03255 [Streptomyces sp. NPDC052040]|uniref:hypothetical protein n=1 Tax=unclassified Streptomyces TaxID=2593676 RepID=UPI0037D18793
MIRRTLQGGLLAAVAMLSLVPTAAVAVEGDRAAPAPAVATVPYRPHALPVAARQMPVRPHARPSALCHRSVRHIRHVRRYRYGCQLRHVPRTMHHRYGTHTAYRRRIGYATGATYRHRIGYVTGATYRRHCRHVAGTAYRHHSHRVVGRVATRSVPLNIRSGPGTGYRVVGRRHAQGRLLLVCERHGSYVHGSGRWYRLAHGRGYVSAHYVRTRGVVPWC